MFNLEKFLLKKVNLKLISADNDTVYSSLVQDYSPRYLFLSVPMEKRRNVMIPQGALMDVFFVEKNKPHYFTTKVVGTFNEEGNLYLVIEKPVKILCYDRRQFKRIKVVQKVKIVDINSTPSIIQGEILDLSGSSAKVKVKATGLRDKNYLLQFKIGNRTFHILGFPEKYESDNLSGFERLYSVYIMKFNRHDELKIKELVECIDRLADLDKDQGDEESEL